MASAKARKKADENKSSLSSIAQTRGDKVFDIFVNIFLLLAALITIYPIYFVLLASISSPAAIASGRTFLLPSEPSLAPYKHIMGDARIWRGYANTIFYTLSGTILGLLLTIPSGYALSRKDLVGNGIIMKLMVFTMYFSGGLVPTYMVIKNLNMVDSPSVMIILGSFTVYNLIVTRTFFMSKIPDEMLEASQIDGCGNFRFFTSIVLPLSKEIVAVMVLYIAVYHWNAFFNAMIYLQTQKRYPLQLILREILVGSQSVMTDSVSSSDIGEMQRLAETIKYGVMIVSSVPILILYPFVQRYFVRGVMLGSIKG